MTNLQLLQILNRESCPYNRSQSYRNEGKINIEAESLEMEREEG
jgi:hypothetical protein